jgi:hypothetical protein
VIAIWTEGMAPGLAVKSVTRAASQKRPTEAVKPAREAGGKVMQAYPAAKTSTSYRFMRFKSFSGEAGFFRAGRGGSRRHVMRKGQTRGAGGAKTTP